MRKLLGALLAVSLSGSAALAGDAAAKPAGPDALTSAPHLLMQACSTGREQNRSGMSFWSSRFVARLREMLRSLGYSHAGIQAARAQGAVAMSQACPDVW